MTKITTIKPEQKQVWVTSIDMKHLDELRSEGWQVFYGKDDKEQNLLEGASVCIMQEEIDNLKATYNL